MIEKWDKIYSENSRLPAPARVLAENGHLLPRSGDALDLACGLGGNALYLAANGLTVSAWDISQVAIEKLARQSESVGCAVRGEVRDISAEILVPLSFNVIAVAHFLDRSLTDALARALRPGGLLFYQTFTKARVDDSGPRNPEFRLDDNELLQMFGAMRIVAYREEGDIGDVQQGFRNLAMLVAQKR